jgi:hypothetical protein
MTDEPRPDEGSPQQRARELAQRRRRMAEIFGDVIPDQTSDDAADSGEGQDRRTEEKSQEDWLKSQVPPHHG